MNRLYYGDNLEVLRRTVQYHDVGVGQTIPMHSHPHYVVFGLETCKPDRGHKADSWPRSGSRR